MDHFTMNGDIWEVVWVYAESPLLVDRTNRLTVATTDPKTFRVYLSNALYGDFLMQVFIHELGHCALYSYGLLEELHRMVYPEYWIDAEEWACNFIADYGFRIFKAAFRVLGYDAWKKIPDAFDLQFAS